MENWSFIHDLCVDQACEKFTETLLKIMSECIPSKEIIIRPNDKPWFDSEIRRFTKHRDRQSAIALRIKKSNDWLKYKNLRNKINNLKNCQTTFL